MELKQNFDVIIKDVNGNVIYEFHNVKPTIQASTVTISDGKFVKNEKVVLECVAENALSGEINVLDTGE